MEDEKYKEELAALALKFPEYDYHAYDFVNRAVAFTVQKVMQAERGRSRHVSGQELVDGCLEFAVRQYSFLAPQVFEYWRIKTAPDIGAIVYRMINAGILSASPEDRLEDFELPGILPDILQERSAEPIRSAASSSHHKLPPIA